MAILNQKRILNLIPKVSAPVTIHVSQGDVGTEIEFTLVKGDEVFVNPGNVTASVHGVREDGANFGPFTCTLSGSKVTFPLHSEMTAVKGSALAEIVLVDNGGNKVGSANFGIMVEESVFPLGVTYDNDVSVYESILAYVQTIPAQVEADFNTSIAQEAQTRAAADTAFNTAIAQEAQTRAAADTAFNTALSSEKTARENAVDNLQAQINQLIAPSGEAPSAAEVENARIGANNVTYTTLGDAIRNQFSIDARATISSMIAVNGIDSSLFEKGGLNQGNDDSYNSGSRIRTAMITSVDFIRIKANSNGAQRCAAHYFNEDGTYKSMSGSWLTELIIAPKEIVRLVLTSDPVSSTESSLSDIYNLFDIENLTGKQIDIYCDYEHGSIDADGTNVSYGTNFRARDRRVVHNDKSTYIVADEDYEFMLFTYYKNGSKKAQSGWIQGVYNPPFIKIPADSYYRAIYEKHGNTSLSLEDIMAHFKIVDNYEDFAVNINTHSIKNTLTKGTYTNNGFSRYNSLNRIATFDKQISSKDLYIKAKTGKISVWYLDSNGDIEYGNGAWHDDAYIPANQYFAFTAALDPTDSTTTHTLDEVFNDLSFDFANAYPHSSDANVIYQSRNVASYLYPPYSKWYIQAAAKNQYDRVRFNVRVTSDGEYVLIHDNTINDVARNIDGSTITEPVNSSGTPLSTLNSYDWGIKYGAKYAGYHVPMLDDACKFAAAYNLGVTIETVDIYNSTDREGIIDDIASILAKYGLLENTIIITGNGHVWDELNYWKTKSKYISFYIGGEVSDLTSPTFKTNMDALKTGYNSIWVQPFPWHTLPTPVLIEYCNTNDYKVYSSIAESKDELINYVGLNHGATLIEAQDVFMIKDMLTGIADDMVDA